MGSKQMSTEERIARLRAIRDGRGTVSAGREAGGTDKRVGARVGATAGDAGAQLLIGAAKGVEGVADLLIGLTGAVGGAFSGSFASSVKDVVSYDAVGNWFGNALVDATGASYLRQNKGGQIAEEVISGVGQMLPALAAAIATGGASAAASGSSLAAGMSGTAAQAASLGTLMASAAGSATEEAYQDGADYYPGLAYGVASGAVEGATEKMFGGLGGLFGDGAIKGAAKGVAKTGVRRIAKEAAGEAVEEMTSELVNPALRSIYKGRAAFEDYVDPEYWKGVGEAGLVGGLTSVAYGGTVGRALKTTGVYADAGEVLSEIEGLERRLRTRDANGHLTAKERGVLVDAISQNYELLSGVMQDTSEKKRNEIMEWYGLSGTLEADGSLTGELRTRLDARQGAAHGADSTAYSAALLGREEWIKSDLERMQAQYREETGSKDAELRLHEGELGETAREAWQEVKLAANAMNRRSGLDIGVALVDGEGGFHGAFAAGSGTVYINAADLASGRWSMSVVHEFLHAAEGTDGYAKLYQLLAEDDEGAEAAHRSVTQEYVSETELTHIMQKLDAGEALTDAERAQLQTYRSEMVAHMAEALLGNERFIARLVRSERGLVGRILNRIQTLGEFFQRIGRPEARQAAARLRAAEKLYLEALDAAGLQFDGGKVVPKEENSAEAVDNEEKIVYSKNSLYKQISKQEYAVINSRIMEDNSRYAARSQEPPRYGVVSSANYFYVYEDLAPGSFGVLKQIKIEEKNRGYIASIRATIGRNNGEQAIRSTGEFSRMLEILRTQSGHDHNDHALDSGRRANSRDGRISIEDTESNSVGYSQKSDGNKQDVRLSKGGNYAEQAGTENRKAKFSREGKKVRYIPYSSIGAVEIRHIRSELQRLYSGTESGIADGIAIESGSTVYVLDSGKENGEISFGIRKKLTIINNDKRKRFVENVNEESGKNGYGDRAIFEKLGIELDHDNGSNGRRQLREVSRAGRGEPDNKQGGVSREDADHRGLKFSREGKKVAEGVRIRMQANRNGEKVYSRADASRIVNQVLADQIQLPEGMRARLIGQSRAETVQALYQALNTLPDGERGGAALQIADYIIKSTMVEDVAEIPREEHHRETLQLLREYLHKLDLSSAREQLKRDMGKRASAVYLLWGKREGGISPDAAKEALAARGLMLDATTPGDIISQIDKAYCSSRDLLQGAADTALKETLSENEYQNMRQEIAKQILRGYDTTGETSQLARVQNKYTEQIRALKKSMTESKAIHTEINRLLDRVQRIKQWKTGEYLSSSEYKKDGFLKCLGGLTKLRYRGDLRQGKVRQIIGELRSWYHTENPLYAEADRFNSEVSLMITEVAEGEGHLSLAELKMVSNILDYFAHEVKTFRCVYRQGKYVEAQPIAKAYKEGIESAGRLARGGAARRFLTSGYGRLFADPPSLVRNADGYRKGGWFTDFYEMLRRGEIDSAVTEMDLLKPFDKLLSDRKYQKHFLEKTISYNGISISLRSAMSLYMTLKRAQAQAGLATNGIKITSAEDDTLRLVGFAQGEKLKEDELQKLCRSQAELLSSQFTAEDRRLIAVMEETMEKCREIKRRTDLAKDGFSNVEEDSYYWPIKRANVARTVDKPRAEVERVSHLSFNKSTVKGARGELLIEPCDVVFRRHLHGIALYGALGVETANINRLMNLNLGDMPGKPVTILSTIDLSGDKLASEVQKYLIELKSDIEGDRPQRTQRFYNNAVRRLRTGYAEYQLGLNPKVLVNQLSSLIASADIIGIPALAKGFGISGKDVDTYCRLAELRNADNAVVRAESVLDGFNKVGDALMKPIGAVDRFVVCRLFAACQAQVARDGGALVGTVENKTEAGKLLERVILETQQNSLLTERSAAMRSGDELLKGSTMFKADSMKVFGRMIDAWGQWNTLHKQHKAATGEEKVRLSAELKGARGQLLRSTVVLLTVSIFNALVAYGFKLLYNRDDRDPKDMITDSIGNIIGGLPILAELYAYFADGYEIDSFLLGSLNDMLGAAKNSCDLLGDAISGREVTRQDVAGCIRKVMYAAGQGLGIPIRNAYNFVTGIVRRVSTPTAYEIDSAFYHKNYSADLKSAIKADDERLIQTISSLMVEDVEGLSKDAREILRGLLREGYSVLPRALGSSVTVDGEEVTLTAKQRKRFRAVYDIADDAVELLVKDRNFRKSGGAVQAKTIRFIYDTYYQLALDDFAGTDAEEKNVLFAQAIDIEKLALIVMTASSLTAERDRQGNVISGSKKQKVQAYVNSLGLLAAQKYMVMGYLGYRNLKGEAQVQAYVSRLGLSPTEKTRLMKYSGYSAA